MITFTGHWTCSPTIITGVSERTIVESQLPCSFIVWLCYSGLWWDAVFGDKKTHTQVGISAIFVPIIFCCIPILINCDWLCSLRDLAARNILVFSKNKVKISDFGLSRALGVGKDYYQTNFNVNLKLPIAWYDSISLNVLTSISCLS